MRTSWTASTRTARTRPRRQTRRCSSKGPCLSKETVLADRTAFGSASGPPYMRWASIGTYTRSSRRVLSAISNCSTSCSTRPATRSRAPSPSPRGAQAEADREQAQDRRHREQEQAGQETRSPGRDHGLFPDLHQTAPVPRRRLQKHHNQKRKAPSTGPKVNSNLWQNVRRRPSRAGKRARSPFRARFEASAKRRSPSSLLGKANRQRRPGSHNKSLIPFEEATGWEDPFPCCLIKQQLLESAQCTGFAPSWPH